MKSFLLLLIGLSIFGTVSAQKRRKKDLMGGPKDYRTLSNNGLQVSLGPTYTFAKNSELTLNERINYSFEPSGRWGLLGEIGTAHFSLKKPRFRFGKIIDYTDWGIGGVIFGGNESTYLMNKEEGTKDYVSDGYYYHFFATARVTFHNMWYIPTTTFFLDNGLGLNVDFRALKYVSYTLTQDQLKAKGITQQFANPLVAQIHYNGGIGKKLKRGSYLIASAQLPVVGIYEWNNGSPRGDWFSSKYLPVIFRLKYIYLFEKKTTGCENFGSEEDRKRNEEYMQNK